jgi:hypothetical protein
MCSAAAGAMEREAKAELLAIIFFSFFHFCLMLKTNKLFKLKNSLNSKIV